MRVEIVVAKRTGGTVPIPSYIRLIVRQTNASGDSTTVVGRTDIPAIRGVAQEPGMIGATEIGPESDPRCRVAVICGKAESLQHSRHEG